MSILLNGFHPTFDALSAHADLSDVDAARTRVGKHVARCAACAAEVAAIRALGDAARAVEVPGAPAGLWARIAQAQAAEPSGPPMRETPPPDADVYVPAPALRPTRHVPLPGRRGMRRAGIGLAAAAVIVAVLLVPRDREARLQAAGSRDSWRLSPTHPRPGAPVTVRFAPTPSHDAHEPTFLLLGGVLRRWDAFGGTAPGGPGRLQDSLTMLVRGADGAYTGRFTMPESASALVIRLAGPGGVPPRRVMSPSGPVAQGFEPVTLVVSADVSGRPSLAALSLATDFWTGNDDERYRVADTLVKYYPSEPIGYAAAEPVPAHRLIDDIIGWFRSGERQYLRFDRRFMEAPRVSVEHEMAMIRFANRIAEPGEEQKWTLRLAREHGDDPRALYMYESLLSRMLSRYGTSDSVRRMLPLADSLYERNGHRGAEANLQTVAGTVHDTVAARRWAMRATVVGARDWQGQPMGVERWLLTDPAVRDRVRERVREWINRPCVLPPGRYPVWSGIESWTDGCFSSKATSYATLADMALIEGHPAAALVLADSGYALLPARERCWRTTPLQQRGSAKLALGDTAGAAVDLASGSYGTSWRNNAYRDSVGRVLRPAVSAARWNALVDSSGKASQACLQQFAQRDKARADSLKRGLSR